MVALAACILLAPAGAQARFLRPYLRQITGTCPLAGTCSSGEIVPFGSEGPLGVATDASGDLWVGENPTREAPFDLDEFGPAGTGSPFAQTIHVKGEEEPTFGGEPWGFTAPARLAIDRLNGRFYLSSASSTLNALPAYVELFAEHGAYAGRFGPFGEANSGGDVAVDNSNQPSDGSVYVAHAVENELGNRRPEGVEKFGPGGEEESFTASAPYISGNEITGSPAGAFGYRFLQAVAVGPAGDIYVAGSWAILEFASSGAFVREIPDHPGTEWHIQALAVDPNGDVIALRALLNRATEEYEEAVDEFDQAGDLLGEIDEAAPGHVLSGSTVDAAVATSPEGDLYVTEDGKGTAASEHAVAVYGPGAFVAGLRPGEATHPTPTTATLEGQVNPESQFDPEHSAITECLFEYAPQAEWETEGFAGPGTKAARCEDPDAAEIGEGDSYVPVHAALTGLTSGTTYRYRLATSTEGVHGGRATSAALAFTAPHAPSVQEGAVSSLTSQFAELHASIGPLGAATSYHFEYITQEGYEVDGSSFNGPDQATTAPVPDATLGTGGQSGSAQEAVSVQIAGLAPGTAYRFRVVAENDAGVTAGESLPFATLPAASPGLPDGRAYELVTPPNKGDAEDMFGGTEAAGEIDNNQGRALSSISGNELMLETRSAFGPYPGTSANVYVFSRDPGQGRWNYTALAVPGLGVQANDEPVLEPDTFSEVAFRDGVGSTGNEAGVEHLMLLGAPGGPYTTLHADQPETAHGGESLESTQVVGASQDLSHVILETRGHSLCAAEGETETHQDEGSDVLCEYHEGAFRLIDANAKGELTSRCGAALGLSLHFARDGGAYRAVSADGSHVVFEAPDPVAANHGEGCWNGTTVDAPQLYVDIEGTPIEISRPDAGAGEAPTGHHYRAEYDGASEDGSRVFFTSEAELTRNDAGIHDIELYEWAADGVGGCEAARGCLSRVSRGESGTAAGDVRYVNAVAADGSAVYFMAGGVLAANRGADGAAARPQTCGTGTSLCNLYRYDTASHTVSFVAALYQSDYPEMAELARGPWSAGWDLTPDGRYLLFTSGRSLTGYDTTAATPHDCREAYGSQDVDTGHCEEVYRFDATTGSLICVSCNPSGARPVSSALFARSSLRGAAEGPVTAISNDGSYVFFDTSDALVPADSNGTTDVYEWHEGRISLISSGADPSPSFFLSASPDGANVFFGTHARLVPADTDSAGDVYDARICTGEDPCIRPSAGRTAQCEGSACQSVPPAPLDATPTSMSFAGPGNLPPQLSTSHTHAKKSKAARGKRLARALRRCRSNRSRRRRLACERRARASRRATKASARAARHIRGRAPGGRLKLQANRSGRTR